ncbi:MAG: ABC transporter substrate-binding protein [Actinobacteria bacterium]|nr:ABC transporter substrate-binding protein [Actinomycetota bacterium]
MTKKLDQLRGSVGPLQQDVIDDLAAGSLSRRGFLVRGSVVGLSAAFMGSVLAACGSDDETSTTQGGSDTTAAGGDTTVAGGDTTVAPGAIQQGGTLRIASQRPGSELDPILMDNLGAYTPVVTAFEYLCGPGEGAALAPMLAESWEPNADGSEWTFKLRQGVKWHSGADFTAADVVATMDRLAVEGGKLAAYLVPGATTAADDFTVTMKLNAPDGQFPYNVCHWNPQTVITPADYEAGTTLDKRPDGTGAFKLEKFDVSTGATFIRNDEWWGGTPYLDALEFIFSDDISTQVTGLQGGAADVIVQFSVIGGEAIMNDSKFTVEAIRGAAHRQLWMNVREGTFTDVKVREAVALGLDRQALIDTALGGKGDLGNDHPIAPVYEFWDSSQPQRERDIDKAKALLEEAGKAGLAITMHAPKLQEIPQLAELMQSQLKDIGMDITLNVESTDTFYDRWCKVYDSVVEPAGCDGGEEFGIVDYGNRGVPDVYLVKAYSTGEWNSAHYISEDFRTAVKDYQAALTLEDRKEPVTRIQTIANADIPYVIPYFYNSLYAYTSNVTGIKATGLGHYYCGTAGFTA